MPDLEKAIRVLEGSYKNSVLRHNGELIAVNELLSLLKAQEPRVMTLEEVLTSDKPFLIEVVTGKITWASCFGEYCLCDDMVVRMVDNDGAVDDRYKEMYGTKWRCWTSRPDKATREATPWN